MAGITFRVFITFMGVTRAICTVGEEVVYSYMPQWGTMNCKGGKILAWRRAALRWALHVHRPTLGKQQKDKKRCIIVCGRMPRMHSAFTETDMCYKATRK